MSSKHNLPAHAQAPVAQNDAAGERLHRAAAFAGLPLPTEVILGQRNMTVAEVLNLRPGAVVAVDRPVGAAADLVINGVLVAEGDLVANESGLQFRVSRIVSGPC